jgi:hypothetical protein
MHPDPGQRPNSCAELVEELTAAVGSASSVETRPDVPEVRPTRPGGPQTAPAAVAAAAGGRWSQAGAVAVAAAAALGVTLGVVAALWR